MSKDLKSSMGDGFKQFTNPQNLTVNFLTQVINSGYTKTFIRKFLLDPVTKRVVPSRKFTSFYDIAMALYTLYKIDADVCVDHVLAKYDSTKMKKRIDEGWNKGYMYYIYEIEDKMDLVKLKSGFILFTIESEAPRSRYEEPSTSFTIHFFPPFGGLKKEFDKMYDEVVYHFGEGIQNDRKRMVRVINFSDQSNSRVRPVMCTVPKTIILDHVQDDIKGILSAVRKSDDISKDFEIDKTTGVLLYGPHGTGKSTIARYLAMELKRTLILTNAQTLPMALAYIQDHSGDDMKYVILLEDIDFAFVDRRKMKKDTRKMQTDMMQQTDLLFQILDGVLASSNFMVVATTNYIERLDPALIRDGRFDFKIEVMGLEYEQARKVCERFEITPESIRLSEWRTPINPASLQTVILKYKTSGGKAFFEIPEPTKRYEELEEESTEEDTDENEEESEEEGAPANNEEDEEEE